jgi:hypothetical protein
MPCCCYNQLRSGFLDELLGIESVQVVQYAAPPGAPLQLAQELFWPGHSSRNSLNRLEHSQEQSPGYIRDGRHIYEKFV